MIYLFSFCKGPTYVLILNFAFNKRSFFEIDLFGEGNNKIYLRYFIIKILLLLLNFQKLKHIYKAMLYLATVLQGLFVCLLNNSCVFPGLRPLSSFLTVVTAFHREKTRTILHRPDNSLLCQSHFFKLSVNVPTRV